jgi:hypothetical protein
LVSPLPLFITLLILHALPLPLSLTHSHAYILSLTHSNSLLHTNTDYVGSNNIPLLTAGGQFGTRAKGGNDYASPRYIFTGLNSYARLIYPEEDDEQLDYLYDDGQQIEPKFFLPIIPMLLVNGSYGIGTGWSTFIPPHNPITVADHTMRLVRGESDGSGLRPWVRGFQGTIEEINDGRGITYRTRGIINRVSKNILEINELPYGKRLYICVQCIVLYCIVLLCVYLHSFLVFRLCCVVFRAIILS